MKKKLRKLKLRRETLRKLSPENLDGAAGGYLSQVVCRTDDTCVASCPPTYTIPQSVCFSLFATICDC